MRILLAEDHDELRLGMSILLRKADSFEIAGEARNGREAVELARKISPDVILMDVGMPVMDGIESCRIIKSQLPDVKVVMLTSHDSEQDVFAALAAGANGYCLKETDIQRLIIAIRSVFAGDLWLDSAIAEKVLGLVRERSINQSQQRFPHINLSPRELEVLKLIVEGLSNNQIGEKLNISLDTVKSHIRHIMDKLSVSDRTQAAVRALRSGLI